MSVAVDYFFNHPQGLDELARGLKTWLGCALEPYQGDPNDLHCRFLGMELSLRCDHDLENDREADFENFRFQLGFRVPSGDRHYLKTVIPAMHVLIFGMHHRLGIFGLLVWDVQRVLARFEERLNPASRELELFDLVSERFLFGKPP